MTLGDAMKQARVTLRPLARATGISVSALCRVTSIGEYPVRIGEVEAKRRIAKYLTSCGIDVGKLVWPEWTLPAAETEMVSSMEGIELMQLDRNVLTLFGLRSNPFINDVETDDDVHRFRGYEVVEQAIRDTIDQRGFLAICAESGAGKTTIWDGIEAEYGGREDVVVCKPNVKNKEELSPEHLARTLIYGLSGEHIHIRANAEDRGRQLSQALRDIRSSSGPDRKAVLYIDDAHFCSSSVLRQLKTFFEEKVGRYRLLAIILVGLPTLKMKLAEFPEIGNRIRLVEVPPVNVEEYLAFKLKRAGTSLDRFFDDDGFRAFVDRFRVGKRQPVGRPLLINAMCIRAMVRLYANGAQSGERITREIIDALPGEAPTRKAA